MHISIVLYYKFERTFRVDVIHAILYVCWLGYLHQTLILNPKGPILTRLWPARSSSINQIKSTHKRKQLIEQLKRYLVIYLYLALII